MAIDSKFINSLLKNIKNDVPELFYKKYFYDEYLCVNKTDWTNFLENDYYDIRNYVLYEYVLERFDDIDCINIINSVNNDILNKVNIHKYDNKKSDAFNHKCAFLILRNFIPDFKIKEKI